MREIAIKEQLNELIYQCTNELTYVSRFTLHVSRLGILFNGESQFLYLFKFWAIQKEANE